jgi:glycosyltransferase involved in cell wall biosynthesis
MSDAFPELSVVIPFYNEQGNAAALVREVRAVAEAQRWNVEVLAVDDGSTDDTARELAEVAADWSAVRVILQRPNRGQAAALWTGLQAARAPLIATMDGDGQNVPADLPALRALLDRCDMAVGWRRQRNDSALRRMMSRLANAVRGRLMGDRLHDAGCALKVMRREVVGSFLPLKTLYSFMPAMAVSAGFRLAELPVQHRERRHGRSAYGLAVMWWRPCLDMLTLKWVLGRRLR